MDRVPSPSRRPNWTAENGFFKLMAYMGIFTSESHPILKGQKMTLKKFLLDVTCDRCEISVMTWPVAVLKRLLLYNQFNKKEQGPGFLYRVPQAFV